MGHRSVTVHVMTWYVDEPYLRIILVFIRLIIILDCFQARHSFPEPAVSLLRHSAFWRLSVVLLTL